MVRRRTRQSDNEAHGDDGHGADARTREGRGQPRRRMWRRFVDGASEIIEGVVDALGPAPRPAAVPIPVRTTRQVRPS